MAGASLQGATALEEHFPYHVLPASAEDVCDIMMILNLASQNPLDSVVIEVPDFLKFIEYYKNLLSSAIDQNGSWVNREIHVTRDVFPFLSADERRTLLINMGKLIP